MQSLVECAEPLPGLTDVAATAWLTLGARARAGVDPDLADFDDALARSLVQVLRPYMPARPPDAGFVRGVLLRARWFDEQARAFFLAHPGGTAITLGAGFCTRWHRLRPLLPEPGPLAWWNLDLPSVIAWRRRYMPQGRGEQLLPASLLDTAWLDRVGLATGRPVLLLLEGVCPYLPQGPLEALLATLAARLEADGIAARLLLDFVHPAWTRWTTREQNVELPVCSGFEDVGHLTALHPSIHVLALDHPFARISAGHRGLDETFRAVWGQRPYTQACLALGACEAEAAP
jgi:O-methyltransferase involved in polyketide biosynthesis